MSDGRYTWDLNTPHPNVEIEAIRVAVLQALDDLAATVADAQAALTGVDDAYWLSDLLFSQLDATLGEVAASAAERQQLRADLDALTARVTALEQPPADPAPEVTP